MYTIPGLIEGSKYHFRVSAVNSVGQGPPAQTKDPLLIKSPFELPGRPMGPEVPNIFHDKATLYWRPPRYIGGVALIDYVVEVCEVATGKWHKVGGVDAGMYACVCTGLACDTEYRFRVVMVNTEGDSTPLEGD